MPSYRPKRDVALGIGLVLLLHILVLSGLVLIVDFATRDNSALLPPSIIPIFFVGIIQFIYVFPLLLYYHRRQRRELAKGIVIAAIITFLLNAGCFIFVFSSIG